MFRSTYFILYAMFSMLCSSFCSRMMLRLHAHMLTCLYDVICYALLRSMYLCVYFHAIWLGPCLHMLVCLDPCSSMSICARLLHVYMHVSMPICLDLYFHMPKCLDPI